MRKNLLDLKKEHWRPPVYSRSPGFISRIKILIYFLLDLQTSTISRDLATLLPKIKGDVLDVGCGIQPFRGLFSVEVRYQGIDTANAKPHFGYETPDTIYYSGSTWPVKNQSVDFILCTETLEHVDDPQTFLKQAARVLRPAGKMVATIPFAVRWHFIPYDYWRYTPSSLNNLLTKAGFTRVKVYARGNQLTVACYKVMAFIFALLAPVGSNFIVKNFSRLLGILCLPFLAFVVLLGNLSALKDGSVDCLGYTVIAEKPSARSKKAKRA
jgi:SAM-dependent methyltransferase